MDFPQISDVFLKKKQLRELRQSQSSARAQVAAEIAAAPYVKAERNTGTSDPVDESPFLNVYRWMN